MLGSFQTHLRAVPLLLRPVLPPGAGREHVPVALARSAGSVSPQRLHVVKFHEFNTHLNFVLLIGTARPPRCCTRVNAFFTRLPMPRQSVRGMPVSRLRNAKCLDGAFRMLKLSSSRTRAHVNSYDAPRVPHSPLHLTYGALHCTC